jgi:hypothetical protein
MNAWNGCIATIEAVPLTYVHGTRSRLCLIAFSESPSDSTWLENALGRGNCPLQKPHRVHIHLHPDIAGYIHLCQPFAQ